MFTVFSCRRGIASTNRYWCALALCVVLGLAFPASGLAFATNGSNWANSATDVYIDFDVTNPASNPPNSVGPTNAAFQGAYIEAMEVWETGTQFQFFANTSGAEVDPCTGTRNGALFADTDCGDAFGSTTLAVQNFITSGGVSTRTYTVFNNTKTWNIYYLGRS